MRGEIRRLSCGVLLLELVSLPHDAEIRKAVEQACVEYEREVRAFLVGTLRDVHLADDAFQRMVVKALEAASDVNPATIRGWLFRIALNEARELKRGASRQGRLARGFWESTPNDAQTEIDDGLSFLVTSEETDSVRAALGKLSDNHREVVTRRIHRGQTFAEIAEEMEKPIGTVLTWMRRALMQLRDMSEIRLLNDE